MSVYVKKVSGQWKYRTAAWPDEANGTNASANFLTNAITDVRHTTTDVVIFPGTYYYDDLSSRVGAGEGSFQTTGAWAGGVVIRGPHGTEHDASGKVHLDGTGMLTQSILKINDTAHTRWHFGENIKVQNIPAGSKYALHIVGNFSLADFGTDGLEISDVKSGYAVFARYAGAGLHKKLLITRCAGSPWYFYNDAAAGTTQFDNAIFKHNGGYVYLQGANLTVVFNQTAGYGNAQPTIYGSCLSCTVNNSILAEGSCGTPYGAEPSVAGGSPLTRVAGVWTVNNSYIAKSPNVYNASPPAGIIYNNCQYIQDIPANASCKFANPGRPAYANFQIDDSPNYGVFKELCSIADEYGCKMELGLSFWGNESVNWAELAALIQQGHGIQCHARSDYRNGVLGAFTFTSSGDTITITVDRSADTGANNSTLWTGTCAVSGTHSGTVSLHDPLYDTVTKLCTWLTSIGVTTLTPVTNQFNFITTDHLTKSVALASGTYTSGQTLLFSEDHIHQTEWLESKIWIESMLAPYIPGFVCDVGMWPGGFYSDNSIAYALNVAGFKSVRATTFAPSFAPTKVPHYALYALNMGKYGAQQMESQFVNAASPSIAQCKTSAIKYFESLLSIGGIGGVYNHGYGVGFSTAYWGAVFEAAVLCAPKGLKIDTSSKQIAEIIADSHHVTNNTTAVRFADGYDFGWGDNTDLHISDSSPCNGAGISIPSIHEQATPATDLDGNTIHFLPPSIGPYDGQGAIKIITSDYSPTGYSVRGIEASPAHVNVGAQGIDVDLSGLTPANEHIIVSGHVDSFVPKGANSINREIVSKDLGKYFIGAWRR
jgi:hypothetical protein